MRLKRQSELESLVNEIVARLDRRLRRPMSDVFTTFEYIRRLKFKSAAAEAQVVLALRATMPKFEQCLFADGQIIELSRSIEVLKHQLAAIAAEKK